MSVKVLTHTRTVSNVSRGHLLAEVRRKIESISRKITSEQYTKKQALIES